MPTAAPTRCTVPGCPAIATARGRCADHIRRPWEQPSQHARRITRAQREAFRRAVLTRDPVCRACGIAPATEADHVMPIADGGAHDPANGAGLCGPCHDAKTRAENAARNRRRAQQRRQQ